MPFYYSGTNCRASGNAMVYGPVAGIPAYFMAGQLSLNGIVVASFAHTPGEPGILSLPLQVRFDSTYFGDGGMIEVTIAATDNFGRPYFASNTAPLKNKARLYQWYEHALVSGGDSIDSAHAALNAVNYAVTTHDDTSWTSATIESELSDCTVFYVHSHGTPVTHQTGAVPKEWLLANSYLGFRQTINGTGFPPFNSTANPPIVLMFLDHCWNGAPSPVPPVENRFAQVLYPYNTAYNEGTANQAVMGWHGSTFTSESITRCARFFGYAALEQRTVAEARMLWLEANVEEKDVNIEDPNGNVVLVSSTEHFRIWGDFYTRISGLYTGSHDLAENIWYE